MKDKILDWIAIVVVVIVCASPFIALAYITYLISQSSNQSWIIILCFFSFVGLLGWAKIRINDDNFGARK